MTDLEIVEQTLWCVQVARSERCRCNDTCLDPCDKLSHTTPSHKLVRFWLDEVLHHKELQKLDERAKNDV